MVISDISMFIESMEYNIEEKKNTKSLEELVDWMDKKKRTSYKKRKTN